MNEDEAWIDVAALASMDGLSRALLPNFQLGERDLVIEASRAFLTGIFGQDGFGEFVLAGTSKLNKRVIRSGISTYRSSAALLQSTVERVLARYCGRIRTGFVVGDRLTESVATRVGSVMEAIINVDIDSDDNEVLEIALMLPAVECCNAGSTSLALNLLSGLSESASPWDSRLLSSIDPEYDQPYLQTIALKLEALTPQVELLNVWREAISPKQIREAAQLHR